MWDTPLTCTTITRAAAVAWLMAAWLVVEWLKANHASPLPLHYRQDTILTWDPLLSRDMTLTLTRGCPLRP